MHLMLYRSTAATQPPSTDMKYQVYRDVYTLSSSSKGPAYTIEFDLDLPTEIMRDVHDDLTTIARIVEAICRKHDKSDVVLIGNSGAFVGIYLENVTVHYLPLSGMQHTHQISATGKKVYPQIANQLEQNGVPIERLVSEDAEKEYFDTCIRDLTDYVFVDSSRTSNSIAALSALVNRYAGKKTIDFINIADRIWSSRQNSEWHTIDGESKELTWKIDFSSVNLLGTIEAKRSIITLRESRFRLTPMNPSSEWKLPCKTLDAAKVREFQIAMEMRDAVFGIKFDVLDTANDVGFANSQTTLKTTPPLDIPAGQYKINHSNEPTELEENGRQTIQSLNSDMTTSDKLIFQRVATLVQGYMIILRPSRR